MGNGKMVRHDLKRRSSLWKLFVPPYIDHIFFPFHSRSHICPASFILFRTDKLSCDDSKEGGWEGGLKIKIELKNSLAFHHYEGNDKWKLPHVIANLKYLSTLVRGIAAAAVSFAKFAPTLSTFPNIGNFFHHTLANSHGILVFARSVIGARLWSNFSQISSKARVRL